MKPHDQELTSNIESQCPHSPERYHNATQPTYIIDSTHNHAVLTWLKESITCQFDQLIDITCIDYLHYKQAEWETFTSNTGYSRATTTLPSNGQPDYALSRFVVIYQLLSTKLNWRLRVHACINNNPAELESVTDLWSNANWLERETYDMFGVVFKNHPDLRRILTDYGFKGYPFRKDFPLIGTSEMRYDAKDQRVVYQPVSIENRVSVGKTIRNDNQHTQTGDYD